MFIDPPYDIGEEVLEAVLIALVQQGWLSADALLVVERSSRSPEPRWPAALEAEGERRYGETRIWFAGVPDPDGVA